MMNRRIIFAIPTLFENSRRTNACVDSLVSNLQQFKDIEYKIFVVTNEQSDEFDKFEFNHPVIKLCGNLQFNIARALNTAAFYTDAYDYFCFVDEGVKMTNSYWIDYIIKLFEQDTTIGLVGARPHSTFRHYNIKINDDPKLYKVLWSDGILFTTKDIMYKFKGFDEIYFGDCETQDFGYRLHSNGYTNIYWQGLYASHDSEPFESKTKHVTKLMQLVKQSRETLASRWREFLSEAFKSI